MATTYHGLNCDATIDDAAGTITLVHDGLLVPKHKREASPWVVPFGAIEDLDWKEKSFASRGYLRLVLRGRVGWAENQLEDVNAFFAGKQNLEPFVEQLRALVTSAPPSEMTTEPPASVRQRMEKFSDEFDRQFGEQPAPASGRRRREANEETHAGAVGRQDNSAEPTPAGWFPDPSGQWEYRYWDGQYWTANVSRAGVAGLDPLPSPHMTGSTTVAGIAQQPPQKPQGFIARRSAERVAKKADREAFEALAIRAARGDQSALTQLPEAIAEARRLWRESAFDKKLTNVLVAAIHDVMTDDVLTEDEASRLDATAEAIGVPFSALAVRAPDTFEELQIGLINAGHPPELDHPGIILQPGEVAYAAVPVALLKTVTKREFRGGSQGISIPLGYGVRYRVGAVRGRSVVVGTELVVDDTGMLTVTSKRVLYMGAKKTLEFRRDKLVGMEQFSDGIRLNVSNRQTASLFRVTGGSVSILAALIAMTPPHVS